MLIDEPRIYYPTEIGNILAETAGKKTGVIKIRKGIYEQGHTNFHVSGYDAWPNNLENGIYEYGVCDNIEQLLEKCPNLEKDPNRQFVIIICEIVASEQSEEGGWRWSKWGDYIGDHKITAEYLYDEKEISSVYVYHIYEKIS